MAGQRLREHRLRRRTAAAAHPLEPQEAHLFGSTIRGNRLLARKQDDRSTEEKSTRFPPAWAGAAHPRRRHAPRRTAAHLDAPAADSLRADLRAALSDRVVVLVTRPAEPRSEADSLLRLPAAHPQPTPQLTERAHTGSVERSLTPVLRPGDAGDHTCLQSGWSAASGNQRNAASVALAVTNSSQQVGHSGERARSRCLHGSRVWATARERGSGWSRWSGWRRRRPARSDRRTGGRRCRRRRPPVLVARRCRIVPDAPKAPRCGQACTGGLTQTRWRAAVPGRVQSPSASSSGRTPSPNQ